MIGYLLRQAWVYWLASLLVAYVVGRSHGARAQAANMRNVFVNLFGGARKE